MLEVKRAEKRTKKRKSKREEKRKYEVQVCDNKMLHCNLYLKIIYLDYRCIRR